MAGRKAWARLEPDTFLLTSKLFSFLHGFIVSLALADRLQQKATSKVSVGKVVDGYEIKQLISS